jgi:hypothetical protein
MPLNIISVRLSSLRNLPSSSPGPIKNLKKNFVVKATGVMHFLTLIKTDKIFCDFCFEPFYISVFSLPLLCDRAKAGSLQTELCFV